MAVRTSVQGFFRRFHIKQLLLCNFIFSQPLAYFLDISTTLELFLFIRSSLSVLLHFMLKRSS